MKEFKVTAQEYARMERRIAKLDALEAGGVDGWEWYDESLKDWYAENEIDERIKSAIDDLNEILVEAEVDQPAGPGCGYAICMDEEAVAAMLRKFAEDCHKIQTNK